MCARKDHDPLRRGSGRFRRPWFLDRRYRLCTSRSRMGLFQSLCDTVLREILGQTFQIFADNGDARRDGEVKTSGQKRCGSFVGQCRFTVKADAALHVASLNDKFPTRIVVGN